MFTVIGDVARDVNVQVAGVLPHDLVMAGDTPARIHTGLGGSATATAAWLAFRGSSVRLIGARGDDEAGAAAEGDLRVLGVDPRLQVVPGATTGTVVVLVDSTGERSMLPDPGANAALSASWCQAEIAGQHLHVSAYPWFREATRHTIECAIESARGRGMTVSIDLNSHSLVHEYVTPLVGLLDLVDVVFANTDEWRALSDQWSPPTDCFVVVKRGAAGAQWSTGDQSGSSPALPVTLVDSTGTGDAFAAGFLSTWVTGGSGADAVAAGNELAAVCATRVGPAPEHRA